jgi:hypothetical protein
MRPICRKAAANGRSPRRCHTRPISPPSVQLVASAANVSSDRVVEDKASNLSAYGLNSPILEVDITGKGGKVSKLEIGDDTPTNSGSYAMLEAIRASSRSRATSRPASTSRSTICATSACSRSIKTSSAAWS